MDNLRDHNLLPRANFLRHLDSGEWTKCWCGKNAKPSKFGGPTLYCSPAHRKRFSDRQHDGRDLFVNYVRFNNGTKAQRTIRRRLVGYQHAMSARTI